MASKPRNFDKTASVSSPTDDYDKQFPKDIGASASERQMNFESTGATVQILETDVLPSQVPPNIVRQPKVQNSSPKTIVVPTDDVNKRYPLHRFIENPKYSAGPPIRLKVQDITKIVGFVHTVNGMKFRVVVDPRIYDIDVEDGDTQLGREVIGYSYDTISKEDGIASIDDKKMFINGWSLPIMGERHVVDFVRRERDTLSMYVLTYDKTKAKTEKKFSLWRVDYIDYLDNFRLTHIHDDGMGSLSTFKSMHYDPVDRVLRINNTYGNPDYAYLTYYEANGRIVYGQQYAQETPNTFINYFSDQSAVGDIMNVRLIGTSFKVGRYTEDTSRLLASVNWAPPLKDYNKHESFFFREVLETCPGEWQVVAMFLREGLPEEVHLSTKQTFHFPSDDAAEVIIDGVPHMDTIVTVLPGQKHSIRLMDSVHMWTLYEPPHHPAGLIQPTPIPVADMNLE